MLILPAIDLRNRQVVRLARGDFAAATVYGNDPIDVAKQFEEAGAKWVHMVDLDGAAQGHPVQQDLVAAVSERTNLKVQVGGGVRSLDDAQSLIDAGAERVVVGTAAVNDPALLEQLIRVHAERIVVGIDAKGGVAAIRGWKETSSEDADDVAARAVRLGAQRFVVTDIATDGMLAGPGVELLREVSEVITQGSREIQLIASGGIATLSDLAEVSGIPAVEGVIIGRALYEGKIVLAEAIERFQ